MLIRLQHERKKAEAKHEFEDRYGERIREIRQRAEARQFVDRLQNNSRKYHAKILDIFYLGRGKDHKSLLPEPDVTFGTKEYLSILGLAGVIRDSDYLIELGLGGRNYIVGFRQVHFKAEEADVRIDDPHLTGIIHVVKGNITVDYEGSSYGHVLRVRAPNINDDVVNDDKNSDNKFDYTGRIEAYLGFSGFARHGDFYVPQRFAKDRWWETKPSLDIAVQEGTITLRLRSKQFAEREMGNKTIPNFSMNPNKYLSDFGYKNNLIFNSKIKIFFK
ncbi:MAG: hypothetical protein ABIG89_01615 [Candidatus Woesearchaeota archaeon]